MGDRCFLEINLAEQDLPELQAIVGETTEGKVEDGILTIEEQEVNYGWEEELEEFAKTGIPFYGYHTEGGDYSAASFCGVGGKIYFMENNHGNEVVQYEEGKIIYKALRAARLFEEAFDVANRQVAARAKNGE